MLSTVVVDTLADESLVNGTTSLREAIALAAAGDTVQFKSGLAGTITLGGEQLLIGKNLAVSGPGAGVLSISGNNASRVLEVKPGFAVALSGLTIKLGRADFGGGIHNTGTLTLSNCVVSSNTAAGQNGTFEDVNGREARGGGIYNLGTLALNNTIVTGNAAVGGVGAYGMGVGVGAPAFGGGILNGGGGSATLTNSTLSNNKAIGGSGSDNGFAGSNGAVGHGGAIYSDGADVHVTGGAFVGNRAIGGEGTSGEAGAGDGADANGGAIWANGDLSLAYVKFDNNAAVAGDGGGISDYAASLPGGSASGGAIYTGSIVASLTRCTFSNNSATGGGNGGYGAGGAVYATNGLNVTDSTFDSNKVVGTDAEGLDRTPGGAAYGGAISVSGGVLTIAGSTLSRNSATAGRGTHAVYWRLYEEPAGAGGDAVGGAIAVSSPAFITRSTVFGNTLQGGAGGYGYDAVIMPAGDGGAARGAGIDARAGLSLTACTLAGNTATAGLRGEQGEGGVDGQSFGGGVRGDGKLVFANSLIATNVAGNGSDVSGEVLSMGLGFNLIGKADGSSGWIASDKRGTIATPLDPKLGPLASNGGSTKTMALLPESPALDAGKAFGMTTDQRAATRPRNLASVPNVVGGDGSDIGAFELQSLPAGPAQTPFKSIVVGATPVTIEVEDFDNGGEGVAYHDVDAVNTGGAYRNTGVDLQATTDTGGGFIVGWAKAGEWLEYTVNVQTSGYYKLDFRVASNGPGGTFHFEFEGNDVTETLAVPNTGGWQKWTTVSKDGAYLNAGTHVLRLRMDTNGANGWVGNFNSLRIAPSAVSQKVTIGTATAVHVRDGSFAWTNYGASSTLEVKKSTSSYNREVFLKFDLSALTSVSSAKLRLYGSLTDAISPSIGLAVHAAGNTTWSESALNWSNKPAVDAAALNTTIITGTTAKWYEIDLTAYINARVAAGADVVTLVLRSTTATSTLCQFNSDEAGSNRPELVVTT